MKKKFAIVNVSLVIAVLFSMLFQSFHSYEHLAQQLSEQHCHHEHQGSDSQITHQHHGFDHCFSCEFTFSSFVSCESFSSQLRFAQAAIPYFFSASETPARFSGSSYSLRGPPVFIV